MEDPSIVAPETEVKNSSIVISLGVGITVAMFIVVLLVSLIVLYFKNEKQVEVDDPPDVLSQRQPRPVVQQAPHVEEKPKTLESANTEVVSEKAVAKFTPYSGTSAINYAAYSEDPDEGF